MGILITPKISYLSKKYNKAFIGIKGYTEKFKEISVNYIRETKRPELTIAIAKSNDFSQRDKFIFSYLRY